MRDTVLTLKRLFGEEWKNLMLLSIAAAVFSLPLITIGPSLLALHGVLMRIMDGTCDLDRFREFRSLFRACFWRGLMLEAAAAGYLLVMFWCVALQDAMGSGKAALQTALWVSLFLAGGVAVYLIPLLADKSLSGRQALGAPWTWLSSACPRRSWPPWRCMAASSCSRCSTPSPSCSTCCSGWALWRQ